MAQLSGYWKVKAHQRVQSVLKQVDLSDAADERLATYSKGMLLLVLVAHRLINPTVEKMFIGALGLLPTTLLISVLTVALSSPIATRLMRILFLTWIAVVLFSISPIFSLPSSVLNVLEIVRIPLWPISACYQVSVSGTIGLTGVVGMLLIAVYILGLALVAGMWLERRELLLY
jgi:hypothetical protein